jgi:hypothetical protein
VVQNKSPFSGAELQKFNCPENEFFCGGVINTLLSEPRNVFLNILKRRVEIDKGGKREREREGGWGWGLNLAPLPKT